MKLILDVMGGDNPAAELVRGAVAAMREYGTEIVLVGREAELREALAAEGASGACEIVNADDVVTMEDEPTSVLRAHKESSMTKAVRLLADGAGDAMVSTGNTGALFTAATLIVHRIPGIRRAALATILPYSNPVFLLDCGANVTVTPDYLTQFAYLGSVYIQKVFGVASPRVGLLNNGAEAHKGTPLYVDTHRLLSEMQDIRFIGNVEGKEIPFDVCDVLICDGFTGNILLKTSEGLCRYLTGKVAGIFGDASEVSPDVAEKLRSFTRFFDAREYGGAPFLGLAKPVIKAHGGSDAVAFKSAIRQAITYAETGVIAEIEAKAETLTPSAE